MQVEGDAWQAVAGQAVADNDVACGLQAAVGDEESNTGARAGNGNSVTP
jgi:hypothetical protein